MSNIKFITSYHGVSYLFLILYSVGLLLFFLPITHDLFIAVTPYTLVLVSSFVFYYHKSWNPKTIGLLMTVFVLSILIENIGVATGKLFGTYTYGIGLGFKVFHVPILIGLNWVVLVYASNGIIAKITSNSYLKIIGSSALMVIYDYLLELAAPAMQMWEFDPINPPLQNYAMWFLLAVIFQVGIEVLKVNTHNRSASVLFVIQMLFFLLIAIGISILQG